MKYPLFFFGILFALSSCAPISSSLQEGIPLSKHLSPDDALFEQEDFSKKIREAVLVEQQLVKDVELYLEIQEETEEILRVDIKLTNPTAQNIQSIQSWLSYSKDVLQGVSITFPENSPFSLVAPGEDSFDEENGIVRLGVSVGEARESFSLSATIAQITFKKKSLNFGSIEFFDAGILGHTRAMIMTKNGLRNILNQHSLNPIFISGGKVQTPEPTPIQEENSPSPESSASPNV
jgi:hypothetical protein